MTISQSCPECEDPDTEQTPLGLWCFSCGDYVKDYVEEKPMDNNLQSYFERCSNADWFYDYSDDSVMWNRGKKEIQQLKADANEPAKQAIFEAWQSWAGDSMSGRNPTRPSLQAILQGLTEATGQATGQRVSAVLNAREPIEGRDFQRMP